MHWEAKLSHCGGAQWHVAAEFDAQIKAITRGIETLTAWRSSLLAEGDLSTVDTKNFAAEAFEVTRVSPVLIFEKWPWSKLFHHQSWQ
jgi:hypothetical protein